MIDVASIDAGDDIAGFQTRLLAWTGGIHRADECPVRRGQTERQRQLLADILDRNTDAAAHHLAVFLELLLDVQGQINRNGKRHAHITAGTAINLRIHADHFAVDVEQRAARIAGIHRGIGLNEGDVAGLTTVDQRTAERTDDARGDAVLKSERRADGNGPWTPPQFGRTAKRQTVQTGP